MISSSVEVLPLKSVYELPHHPGLQRRIRRSYHTRMLADLLDFASATEQILNLPSTVSEALHDLSETRLSPGLAHAHAEFSLLVGDRVPTDRLQAVYNELGQALQEPMNQVLRIRSFTPEILFHWRFRQFALEQEEISSRFDNATDKVKAALDRIPDDEFTRHRMTIDSVLDTLKVAAPAAYYDITELVSDIGVFRGRPIRGASAPAFFGCVLVREPDEETADWIWFADHLTHEAAHHRLYTAIVDEPLVADNRIVKSPVRKDPRPLSGVVHALYVETKLIDTFRKVLAAGVTVVIRADLELKLDEFEWLHRQCVEVISENREALTSGGIDVLDYCASAV